MKNNNLPLVSVLIPAYNHEKYVQETINSIINQTYQNIELIVIDDGSKDSTWAKIQELKEKCEQRFAKIHFETKQNEGTCATLNRLISLAEGDFIYIIDSDDLAKPQAIEKEVDFLKNNPDYVLVVGDNEVINASSERIGWDRYQNSVSLANAAFKTFGDFLKAQNKNVDFLSDDFGKYETFVTTNYIPNGYLIVTSAIKSFGGFTKEAPLEDWYLHLQLSKIGKYKYLDEIVSSYRWHVNNTIKRAEYMRDITYKTQLYEYNLVASLDDKKWKQIFDKKINRIKMKFNLLNLLKYYSLKDLTTKQYILEICGRKFVLKTCSMKK